MCDAMHMWDVAPLDFPIYMHHVWTTTTTRLLSSSFLDLSMNEACHTFGSKFEGDSFLQCDSLPKWMDGPIVQLKL